MHNQREKFWKKRAQHYKQLEWATKSGYLHAFLDAGLFKNKDTVIDIGTGTGIIAHTICPHVSKVIGIDISSDMLAQAENNKVANEEFLLMDAKDLKYKTGAFSKVTARMVFHHILKDTKEAMKECRRVLKKGGLMVFSEGVPPTEHVKDFYINMFKLKEERLTFMENDMASLMKKGGFKKIHKHIHWNRRSSIKNWLDNSGLPQHTKDKIYAMHINLDDEGKKDYNMVITDKDCLIDMKFVILTGEK
ncbi:MAG: class I SAM-dependent methyltransferase [Candidatus Omnitrophica bacterium]|nr:class I SAM-dependent methyltransferase [Candidatus Omnitrophota bacterium]